MQLLSVTILIKSMFSLKGVRNISEYFEPNIESGKILIYYMRLKDSWRQTFACLTKCLTLQ